jgi:hypothetical protein
MKRKAWTGCFGCLLLLVLGLVGAQWLLIRSGFQWGPNGESTGDPVIRTVGEGYTLDLPPTGVWVDPLSNDPIQVSLELTTPDGQPHRFTGSVRDTGLALDTPLRGTVRLRWTARGWDTLPGKKPTPWEDRGDFTVTSPAPGPGLIRLQLGWDGSRVELLGPVTNSWLRGRRREVEELSEEWGIEIDNDSHQAQPLRRVEAQVVGGTEVFATENFPPGAHWFIRPAHKVTVDDTAEVRVDYRPGLHAHQDSEDFDDAIKKIFIHGG